MSNFAKAVKFVLENEGGLNEVSAKADPGGLTNFGISLRLLRSFTGLKLRSYGLDPDVTEDAIRELPRSTAIQIYANEFWHNSRIPEIEDNTLAAYVFDCYINHSPSNAIKFLQRAIWTHGYMSIPDDGILGLRTLALANQYGLSLMYPMMSERAGWYRSRHSELFEAGWLKRAYSEPD